MTTTAKTLTGERADLVESLAQHRLFLRQTVRDLSDEQATLRSTKSELTLAGIIKHVANTEEGWMTFAQGDTSAVEPDYERYANEFRMLEGETLAGLLDRYEKVAERTEELIGSLDLDTSIPLPPAPWFEPGARWSVRRVLLHIMAETAQHAGHADIIRESIDGAKTMG